MNQSGDKEWPLIQQLRDLHRVLMVHAGTKAYEMHDVPWQAAEKLLAAQDMLRRAQERGELSPDEARLSATRQKVDADHRICEHGRDAFADDCGMCELAGTDWAAPSHEREKFKPLICPRGEHSHVSPIHKGKRIECGVCGAELVEGEARPSSIEPMKHVRRAMELLGVVLDRQTISQPSRMDLVDVRFHLSEVIEKAKLAAPSARGAIDWKQKYSIDLHNLVRLEKWMESNHPDLLDQFESIATSDGRTNT